MIETPEQFLKWRDLHDFTQAQAAEKIGVSRRSIATYESVGPIPKTVALACEAISDKAQTSGFFGKLLKEQYPSLGENVLVLPFVLQRASTFEELIEVGFRSDVKEWVQENTPSARLVMRTIITPEMRRREIVTVEFENPKEFAYFKLRWC